MGLVSMAVPYDDRWYFQELLRGAGERIAQEGHTARIHVIAPGGGSTVEAADAVERDFADPDSLGAVVAGFKYRADQSTRAISWRRPVVVIGGSVLGFPSVSIDDIGASMRVVQHLVALGHTRIAHLTGALDHQMDFLLNGRRAKGYTTAIESAGLQPRIVETGLEPEAVRRTSMRLLDSPDRPTAVFAAFDELAFPLLDAAAELGLGIGSDLSVAGIDDHPRAEAADLTTIRQRPPEIGSTAADMLLQGLAAGPDPRRSQLHATTFVARGSTGRVGAPRQEAVAGR